MQRRDFLKSTIAAGTLLPLASGGLFARPLGHSFFARPAAAGDRVLVLINLNGGNDGLNTIVPVNDPLYGRARPSIALRQADTLKLTDDLWLHGSMTQTKALYDAGKAAVIQNVGYPDQDRSHFRSTDIWHTSSNASEILFTGWLGRYLEKIHPEYPATLPTAPFAIQIASSVSLALQSDQGNMGIAIDNPDRFYNLAKGLSVRPDPLPNTLAGPELEYVRAIIEQSNTYSNAIQRAMVSSSSTVQYGNDFLSLQLKIVAALINGGLSTGIYVVTLGGFDTHQGQLARHAQLLSQLSGAVKNFLDDVDAAGNGDRVACMTYSEFGRRLNENGSAGTDHGAAAPQMVFGKTVYGGKILGGSLDLDDLDNRGDIKFSTDFRRLYSSVLEEWFGMTRSDTQTAIGGEFEPLGLFQAPPPASARDAFDSAAFTLAQNTPNPASRETMVTFTLPRETRVRLGLVGTDGREVMTVIDRSLAAGPHRVAIDVGPLPAGRYLYVLDAAGVRASKTMTVVK